MEPELNDEPENQSIPLPNGPIPIGCSTFELPQCPRCFLGYSCNTHGCVPE